MSNFPGPSKQRRAMERAVERRVEEVLVATGVLPPTQRELPLEAAKPPRLNLQSLLAGVGLVGSYVLDQLHAPLWLAVATLLGLVLSAFAYHWIQAAQRRYRLFWTACGLWVVLAVVITVKYPTPSPHTPNAKEIAQAIRELSGAEPEHRADNDGKNPKPASEKTAPAPSPPKLPLISAPRITVELDEPSHAVKIAVFLQNATDVRTTATLNAHLFVDGIGQPTLVDRTVTFAPQGVFEANMMAYTDAEHWPQYVDGTHKVTADLRADYREGAKKMRFEVRGIVEPRQKVFDIVENKWTRLP